MVSLNPCFLPNLSAGSELLPKRLWWLVACLYLVQIHRRHFVRFLCCYLQGCPDQRHAHILSYIWSSSRWSINQRHADGIDIKDRLDCVEQTFVADRSHRLVERGQLTGTAEFDRNDKLHFQPFHRYIHAASTCQHPHRVADPS